MESKDELKEIDIKYYSDDTVLEFWTEIIILLIFYLLNEKL